MLEAIYHKYINVYIISIFTGFTLVGMLGNIWASVVFWRHRHVWRKHHRYQFLFAITEIFQLLMDAMNKIIRVLSNSTLGNGSLLGAMFCYTDPILFTLRSFALCLLMCISTDRLMALFNPFSYSVKGLRQSWIVLGIIKISFVILMIMMETSVSVTKVSTNLNNKAIQCAVRLNKFSQLIIAISTIMKLYFVGGPFPVMFLIVSNIVLIFKVRRIMQAKKHLTHSNAQKIQHSRKLIKSVLVSAVFISFFIACRLPYIITFMVFEVKQMSLPDSKEQMYYFYYTMAVFFVKFDLLHWFPDCMTFVYALSDADFYRSSCCSFSFCHKITRATNAIAKKIKTTSSNSETKNDHVSK